ncbi:sedoheptulose-1,7-bisphosphatase, chloroplastic [Tanacetum coccineum]
MVTLAFNNQEQYEHVGLEVIRSQEGKDYKMAKRDYAWLMISRCSEDHIQLINYYVKEQYTLRYIGGMVLDVSQVVFPNAISPSTKAKISLLFEVAPLGLWIENAGGYRSCFLIKFGYNDEIELQKENIPVQIPVRPVNH